MPKAREYYVIKPLRLPEETEYKRGFELVKYNTNRQVSSIGNVYQTMEDAFISDDAGFKLHRNELASRRIRIVKKHLELGEPKFACYWLHRRGIECFKV
ncbi:MAG: hypothetical protein HKO92_06490 [Flavobacteriaceae bacterium]|nr:hypothetical protein [Flavobacteriaceae bacterium]